MHYSVDESKRAIAFPGKCIVVAEADDYFGGEDSQSYMSQILDNPTWGKLFSCAKESQQKTKDMHHCFFEGFYVSRHLTVTEGIKPITVITLTFGS
jgi:hypothetical protein